MASIRSSSTLQIFQVIIIVILMLTGKACGKFDIREFGSSVVSKACEALGYECCRHPFVASPDEAISELRRRLENDFFGQHLATQIVLRALESHLKDDDTRKALVLSFHGWAGSGKTFLSEQIMKALYKLYRGGHESQFVKFYMASFHFSDPNKVLEYQEKLRNDIMDTVSRCERALFVFDEVDKTPPGVFDALVPFIQHPGKKFEGYNFKRSVFIFISNSGANDITRITYKAWKDGKNREQLHFSDFDKYLSNEAFNKKENGLYRSRIIDKVLVDFFVPFLPMQRDHVISCADAEIRRLGIKINAEKIADDLVYWPPVEQLYSQSGCKKIEGLVKYYAASEALENDMSYSDKGDDDHDSREEL